VRKLTKTNRDNFISFVQSIGQGSFPSTSSTSWKDKRTTGCCTKYLTQLAFHLFIYGRTQTLLTTFIFSNTVLAKAGKSGERWSSLFLYNTNHQQQHQMRSTSTHRCIARSTLSGTLVGPGTIKKFFPCIAMFLYFLAVERNPQCETIDTNFSSTCGHFFFRTIHFIQQENKPKDFVV